MRAPGETFEAYGRVSIRWLSERVSVYSSSRSAFTWSQPISWRFFSGSTRYSGATLRPRMALRIVRCGPGALRVGSSTSPSSPCGSPYISLPFAVNSNRRSATISGWGEPYQRLSVPHTMRLGPTLLISLPSRCAAWSGSSMTLRQTEPSSAYTFGTLPNLWPFFTKRGASYWFSRRALMKPSTVVVREFAFSSPR